MRFYLVLNLKRQHVGPQQITDKGLLQMEKLPGFADQYKVIGECDKNGNLLDGIAEDNFIKKPVAPKQEVKSPLPQKTTAPDRMVEIRPNDLSGLDNFTPEQIERLKQIKNETREQYRSAGNPEAKGPASEGRGSAGGNQPGATDNPGTIPGAGEKKRRGRPRAVKE